jgi:hypothetical protein
MTSTTLNMNSIPLPISQIPRKKTNSLLVNVDIPMTKRLVRIIWYPSKIDPDTTIHPGYIMEVRSTLHELGKNPVVNYQPQFHSPTQLIEFI